MSARLDPSWKVLASPSTPAVDRCVDIFSRPDGTFGFEEFRRDPEDMGAWTPVAYYSAPAVSYYTPAYSPTTVTTYQGILPWRRYSVATYGTPAYVVPAPVTRYYYTPGVVIR